MALQALIKKPSLTRELTHDLSGVGHFLSEALGNIEKSDLFKEELSEFERGSSKLKLHNFPVLYNDFEAHFDEKTEKQLINARKQFRMNFPFLSSLDEIGIYFMPADRQPCAITCFFMNDVLTRIFDIHGRSKSLLDRYEMVMKCYESCKLGYYSPERVEAQIEVISMPEELFHILSPNLGKAPVLNLYQRIFERLSSKYSSLPSFNFLQKSIERLVTNL